MPLVSERSYSRIPLLGAMLGAGVLVSGMAVAPTDPAPDGHALSVDPQREADLPDGPDRLGFAATNDLLADRAATRIDPQDSVRENGIDATTGVDGADDPASNVVPGTAGSDDADDPSGSDDRTRPDEGDDADVTDDAEYVTDDGEVIDAERIRDFLAPRGAPMADEAEAIVAAGVAHDVDPRVVVGIAIAESNAGERMPPSSHNAWGWGGSGPHGLATWDSWEDALDDYTGRLGELYDTDRVDTSFAQTYCPPNWRWWLDTVTWAIDEI